MRWISPYLPEGTWYKGNLHTHTHVSDGGFSVQYTVMGYQHMAKHSFVVITDHNENPRKMHKIEALPYDYLNEQYREKNFTIIEGREESFAKHILGVGCPMRYGEDPIGKPAEEYTLEDYQHLVNDILDDGGIAYICHPCWRRQDYWTAEEILKLEGITGIEILNGDRFAYFSDYAADVWDQVLSAGKKVFAVANDDVHSPATFFIYWNTVLAKSNSREDLMDALRHGSNYCGNGAEFEYLLTDGDTIRVKASDRVNANTKKIFRFVGKNGKCLKIVESEDGCAEYKAYGTEYYVRVELLQNNGMVAFSNPFYLEK